MTSLQHNDPDETIEPLIEDNDPPASHPDDIPNDEVNDSDLETDSDFDEEYQEGKKSAIGTSNNPEHESAVESYDPNHKKEE